MTTRIRFAIWAGVASAVAVLVAGIAGLFVIQRSLDLEVDRRIERALGSLVAADGVDDACALVGGTEGDVATMRSILTPASERCRSSIAAPSPRALGIVSAASDAADGSPRTRSIDGTPWRVASLPRSDGSVAVVAESIATVRAAQRDASRAILLAMGIGVVLAGLVGALAASPATRRIERLVDAVRRAGRDPSGTTRVGRVGSRDLDAAGAAVDALLDDLRATHAAQRRLLADAAHELRTPVTSIRTNAQLLERDPSLDGEPRDIAARIAHQSASLAELITGLVDVAAVGAWSGAADAPVALGDLVDEAVAAAAARWPRVEVLVDADDSAARVDRALVVRALGNLLDNAATHGAEPVRVEVREQVVAVEDSGAGFPDPEAAQEAFRPFVTSGTGSGIGLAFVEHVMAAHGGTAHVARRSPPRIELRFPFSDDSQVRLTVPSET